MTHNYLQEYNQLCIEFEEFRNAREEYNTVIRRKRDYKLPADIAGAEKKVDIQTPELEDALFAIASILTTNPTYLDVNVLDTKEITKRMGRDLALWSARTWQQVNQGRWWDRSVGIDQGRYGVAVMRRLWHPIPTDDSAITRIKYEPFYLQHVNPLQCAWAPLKNPDRFFYYYEIPVNEAQHLFKRQKGDGWEYPSLDDAKKLTWIGEPRPIENSISPLPKLRVLVIDQRKPGVKCLLPGCFHDQREIVEYICGHGDTQGELVNQWDSPFKRSSFCVIPAREIDDPDPHWRYRAMLFPAIAEADTLNFTETLIATRARVNMGDRFYADFTKIPPHLQAAWNELSEGGKKSTLKMPSSTSREIPLYPPLSAFPNVVDPTLVSMTEQSRQRFSDQLPNRYLTGEAYMESRHAPATAYLQAVQSARLPFNLLLANSDYAIWENFDEFFHAIRYWGQGGDAEYKQPYIVAMTGQERTIKSTATVGEVISISAEMLDKFDFELAVETDSETLAEQAQRWSLAVSKWDRGVLTPQQFLREAGYRDTITQMKELRKADLRAELDPELKQLRLEYVRKYLEIETGMIVSPAGSFVLPESAAGELGAGAPGEANPTGAITQGEAGNMPEQALPAQGAPAPQPVNAQQITGRYITPPPVEGPAGGTSPIGGR